ncbi:hypothetical protein Tco_0877027 [Tanacetum coccineum]|uniref:Uncharacterized protein n=1 Tax=Tanacetum coccineum TaxID=301880 RepID=A0ABQ5BTY6_9ASTR
METEVESMVIVPIQQVSSSVPLLILQSSISHLLNQYLLPVKNHSLQLSPPTSALQQSSSVLEMVKSRLLVMNTNGQKIIHLEQVIDNPTIHANKTDSLPQILEMCYVHNTPVSTEEPKNSKEEMADSAWIEAMQDELH